MHYTHLTEDDRYDIYERKGRGETVTEIARALDRHKSSVSRELRRNCGERGYRPKQANERASGRLHVRRGGKRLDPESLIRCVELVRDGHSPAQASGRTALERFDPISHETLYRLIYADKALGGTLWKKLRCCKNRRKRYGSGRQRRGKIPNRVGIEKRCERVDARATVGHWEGDTVIGQNHKYAMVTLVERKTGFALVRKVKTRHAEGVATAIISALKPLNKLVRTITFDNGLEFAHHDRIAAAVDAEVFFADPYSSWQRGSNENWNGLLRQDYPKKSCFSRVTTDQLQATETALNNRARKRLAWRTPLEALLPSAKRVGVALAA
ncbi:MAG: IS30 family transposase [Cytophagaceae bacterium]|nr:MAG: IS30 family transposase [Cytophagaceae bacterium]